ncbi:hypothetical protein FM107_13240 [Sphingobacterium sp. JB170]|nr:hypothetical protein FM107_13240 [Sphingobacterium sp. JB170]
MSAFFLFRKCYIVFFVDIKDALMQSASGFIGHLFNVEAKDRLIILQVIDCILICLSAMNSYIYSSAIGVKLFYFLGQ